MAHNFPVPDEVQLGKLIVSVYKRTPVPVISRLNRIEERLARTLPPGKTRHKVNKIYWWIVLLLTGGMATAAWWVSDIYNESSKPHDNQTMNINDAVTQHADTPAKPELQQEQAKPDLQSESLHRNDTPVIYQREQ